MNKKLWLSIIFIAVSAMTLAADDAAPIKKKGRRPGKPSGGYIELVNTGKVVQVINKDAACPEPAFGRLIEMFEKQVGVPFVTEAKKLQGKLDDNAAARVVVVSDDTTPVLLCAPEDGWAVVNVKPLKADEPNDFAFRTRCEKEIMRGLGLALGCANSMAPPCVMTEFRALSDLDTIVKNYGPDSQNKIFYTARFRGCQPKQYISYRRACQEGIAPAPTNDVQKAIWDEVHQLPSEPIVIKK